MLQIFFIEKLNLTEKDFDNLNGCVSCQSYNHFTFFINDLDIWKDRYEQICNWEKYLYQNGFRMIKIFLHVSKDEQRRRLAERIINPEKHYKFDLSDIRERQYWDEYQSLYSDMLSRSSTKYAPWYVLPADNKWYTRILIAMLVENTLNTIDPKFPPMSDNVKSQIQTIQELFEDVDIKEFSEMLRKLSKGKNRNK